MKDFCLNNGVYMLIFFQWGRQPSSSGRSFRWRRASTTDWTSTEEAQTGSSYFISTCCFPFTHHYRIFRRPLLPSESCESLAIHIASNFSQLWRHTLQKTPKIMFLYLFNFIAVFNVFFFRKNDGIYIILVCVSL